VRRAGVFVRVTALRTQPALEQPLLGSVRRGLRPTRACLTMLRCPA